MFRDKKIINSYDEKINDNDRNKANLIAKKKCC